MSYLHPKYQGIIKEYFDMSDRQTMKTLMGINEADQNTVLTQLTSKLYNMIIGKVDSIDFGTIPSTKGDITKLDNYSQLVECVEIIEKLLIEYKQETTSTQTIKASINNIISRKDLFEKGFKLNLEFPMLTYSTLVLSIVASISFLISSCIEYIKDINEDSFNVILDRIAVGKSKNGLLFKNLDRFNKSCSSGEFDKVLEYVQKAGTNNLIGIDIVSITGIVVLSALALSIIPLIRELIYFFYYTRVSISDFFEIQAELLQLNIYNLENSNTVTVTDKKKVIKKQLKVIEMFKKIANKITVDNKQSEIKVNKEVSQDKKYKSDDVLDGNKLDSDNSLF